MTDPDRLLEIIDALPGSTVALFGDLVLDRFILGTPKRISREAPVIILRHEQQVDVPGGGANALANLAALGAAVIPVGVVGDDEPGHALCTALAALDIDTSHLVTVAGYRTPTKVRILGGGPSSLKHQVARYDIEDELPGDGSWVKTLKSRLIEALRMASALAVSDYGYGTVIPDILASSRSAARFGSWACLDSRYRVGSFSGIHGATPNLQELQAWAGRHLDSDEEVADAAEGLRKALDAHFILATRGNRGMTLVESEKDPVTIPVFGTDEVADVTGAGDTVLATLVASLAAGANPFEAATLANIAGGLVVMKLGTATVSAQELRDAVLTLQRRVHT